MADIFCPGAANIKGTPTLDVKKCPECGAEIELFSTDFKRGCPNCGFVAYNDTMSCIKWCQYARECVGDEMYEKLMGLEATAAGGGEEGAGEPPLRGEND